MNNQPPIDAVITWVDGNDSVHREKLANTLKTLGIPVPSSVTGSRLKDAGELEFCITAILRFAPWIRTIHIVTDHQTPPFVKKVGGTAFADRIVVVDHKEIFSGYEQYLPTFNTRSITTLLHRIPNISDNFIFLNDDYFIIKPVNPSDFFRDNKIVIRGTKKRLYRKPSALYATKKFIKNLLGKPERASYLLAQEVAARIVGMENDYICLDHNPHPRRTSDMTSFFDQHPDILEENIKHPFRSVSQCVSESLAIHIALCNNNAILDNKLFTLQVKPTDQATIRIVNRLNKAKTADNAAFLCVQGLADASPEKHKIIYQWLQDQIGTIEHLLKGPV